MNKGSAIIINALIVTTLISYSSLSQSNDVLPTHCKSDEFSYLNAIMHKDLSNDAGKILSLCADKKEEPIGKLVYRYGAIGKVEMEQVATNANKFGLSTQSDSGSHAGLISISFGKEEYIYEVSEGMGMTTGIRLSVYHSGNQILGLVSNDYYESVMVTINFEKASSPIFKIANPLVLW